jgi:hypothetical protein
MGITCWVRKEEGVSYASESESGNASPVEGPREGGGGAC